MQLSGTCTTHHAVAGFSWMVSLGFVALAGTALAAAPPPPPGPPPEAFTACEGKVVRTACTVQFQDRVMSGSCDALPGESRLACHPTDMPPPGPPPEAFTACEGKAARDVCSVQMHERVMAGSCDAPPGETRLACHPAEMHPHGPPPPEAFTACEGKAAWDVCSVQMHERVMAGSCDAPPGETRLVCHPADMRPHGPPPPEAFTACEGKAARDVCSVQLHEHVLAGSCDAPPGETRLACHPADMHPHGPPPPEAFTACEGKAARDVCSVQLHEHVLAGSCDTPPGESRLACHPNDMPPPPPPPNG
jgi:hypothetical protein